MTETPRRLEWAIVERYLCPDGFRLNVLSEAITTLSYRREGKFRTIDPAAPAC